MYEKKTHGEWLSLLEISGPFLAETVLESHFPQGLDELEPTKKRLLRQAYEEWREAQDNADPIFNELHKAWIDLVLKQGLELDEDNDAEVLKPASAIDGFTFDVPEHGITLRPDYLVVTGNNHPPSLLIQTLPANTDLDAASRSDGWATSPAERLVQLCRATKVRLGLITDGERWMLIDAPEGGVTTYASWYARLWGQEPVTLQAFINLLGIRRFFLHKSQQLPALLDESLKHQDEVTDALGDQVKRAVEVLIQALDKADQDRERELLKDVEPAELYEAGLTVMMRLVFLLSAEERGLLLLGDERYEAYYAVSSLRMQLREQAGLHSEEILSHRRDAWSRLLAIFRAVYGGIDHDALRMPALGGSLFDPDRFPFLEGRAKGSQWCHESAQPLPIDNRTVLLLLDAIQLFQGRTLSYRALDVEQIGYVYEGLLERTVVRAKEVTLELNATKKSKKPWVTWGELEDARLSGEKAVMALLESRTESSTSRIKNDLNKPISEAEKEKLLVVCQGDQALRDRLEPYFHFLRIDPWGYPLIYPKGSFMVATGTDRRETGTHYTPKSLTESIVRETLEPVVYVGPAEGLERKDWKLKSPAEILNLKICDLAMGSGAFLVQVCRWLSERLLEAWVRVESQGKYITNEGVVVDKIASHEPLIANVEERLVTARRLISERCLYGVDINPLAVELAKLSIWLVTLAKGRPFGFLDHNLRHGDSLLGIADLQQLHYLDMNMGKGSEKKLFAQKIDVAVKEATEIRIELRQRPILDIHDVEVMSHLDRKARTKLKVLGLVADGLIFETLKAGNNHPDVMPLSISAGQAFESDDLSNLEIKQLFDPKGINPSDLRFFKPFHWCLEFPEVFSDHGGFDAVLGNPPYLGGTSISGAFGKKYKEYLRLYIASGKRGRADLSAYFLLRASFLIRSAGHAGLILTSSIAEGDTREVGLDQLVANNICITRATSSAIWPGNAKVTYSSLNFYAGSWKGKIFLNQSPVEKISSMLIEQKGIAWQPVKLAENIEKSFNGVKVYGNGFVVSKDEAQYLLNKNPKNSDVIFPYLTTKDVNSHWNHESDSMAIRFFDWPLNHEDAPDGYDGPVASDYPDCLEIIEERVKPERTRLNDNGQFALRKPLPQKWWIYGDKRPALYAAISSLKHVLVVGSQATKYVTFASLPTNAIFSHSLAVVADDSYSTFSILNSTIHDIWAREYCGHNLALLRYSPTDLLETFPFPSSSKDLEKVGETYDKKLKEIMRNLQEGLTDVYNRFHEPSEKYEQILELRNLHAKMDELVIKAYGFDDVEPDHGFHEVNYLSDGKNTRFTICEAAREQLLCRLVLLNKERHEMELLEEKRPINKLIKVQRDNRPLEFYKVEKLPESNTQMDIFSREDE